PEKDRGLVGSRTPRKVSEQQRNPKRQRSGQNQNNHGINHQSLEARPGGVGGLIMIRQQREHGGEIVRARADLQRLHVKLRQLARGQRGGERDAFRQITFEQLQLLERDLAKGVPLATALTARKLPELYVQTLQIGARTNDLPAVLTLLADHYQTANATWTRLKGLMVYPVIILVLSTALSLWIALLLGHLPGSPGADKPSILFGLSTIVSAGPAKPARPRTAS